MDCFGTPLSGLGLYKALANRAGRGAAGAVSEQLKYGVNVQAVQQTGYGARSQS